MCLDWNLLKIPENGKNLSLGSVLSFSIVLLELQGKPAGFRHLFTPTYRFSMQFTFLSFLCKFMENSNVELAENCQQLGCIIPIICCIITQASTGNNFMNQN